MMKDKKLLIGILAVVVISGIGLFIFDRYVITPEKAVREVIVTTDKTEYEQGETVRIKIINNKRTSIYTDFRDNIPIIEEFKNMTWSEIDYKCFNSCECTNGKLDCISLAPPQFFYSEFDSPFEYKWNQTKCFRESKVCGDVRYQEGELKTINGGKFKAKFCYWDKKDVNFTILQYDAPAEKRQCVEKEFTIK